MFAVRSESALEEEEKQEEEETVNIGAKTGQDVAAAARGEVECVCVCGRPLVHLVHWSLSVPEQDSQDGWQSSHSPSSGGEGEDRQRRNTNISVMCKIFCQSAVCTPDPDGRCSLFFARGLHWLPSCKADNRDTKELFYSDLELLERHL